MKIFDDPNGLQEFAQFGVQAIGRLVVIVAVVVLLLAWVLTEPFYELGSWIGFNGKSKIKNRLTSKKL